MTVAPIQGLSSEKTNTMPLTTLNNVSPRVSAPPTTPVSVFHHSVKPSLVIRRSILVRDPLPASPVPHELPGASRLYRRWRYSIPSARDPEGSSWRGTSACSPIHSAAPTRYLRSVEPRGRVG